MNTPREVVVLDRAVADERQADSASDLACRLTDEGAFWLADVFPFAEEHECLPARLPGEDRAGHVWETVAYATLGVCGLVSVGLCFL